MFLSVLLSRLRSKSVDGQTFKKRGVQVVAAFDEQQAIRVLQDQRRLLLCVADAAPATIVLTAA